MLYMYKENNNLSLKIKIISENKVPKIKENKIACLILFLTMLVFRFEWNLLTSGKSAIEIAVIKNDGIVRREIAYALYAPYSEIIYSLLKPEYNKRFVSIIGSKK